MRLGFLTSLNDTCYIVSIKTLSSNRIGTLCENSKPGPTTTYLNESSCFVFLRIVIVCTNLF